MVLKFMGGIILILFYYIFMCRFGMIVTSAIYVFGGGVACSFFVYVARNVMVGIDVELMIEF